MFMRRNAEQYVLGRQMFISTFFELVYGVYIGKQFEFYEL
jgi:hypothetical protein